MSSQLGRPTYARQIFCVESKNWRFDKRRKYTLESFLYLKKTLLNPSLSGKPIWFSLIALLSLSSPSSWLISMKYYLLSLSPPLSIYHRNFYVFFEFPPLRLLELCVLLLFDSTLLGKQAT